MLNSFCIAVKEKNALVKTLGPLPYDNALEAYRQNWRRYLRGYNVSDRHYQMGGYFQLDVFSGRYFYQKKKEMGPEMFEKWISDIYSFDVKGHIAIVLFHSSQKHLWC